MLKRFAGTFRWAQTSYLWRVFSKKSNIFEILSLQKKIIMFCRYFVTHILLICHKHLSKINILVYNQISEKKSLQYGRIHLPPKQIHYDLTDESKVIKAGVNISTKNWNFSGVDLKTFPKFLAKKSGNLDFFIFSPQKWPFFSWHVKTFPKNH